MLSPQLAGSSDDSRANRFVVMFIQAFLILQMNLPRFGNPFCN